MIFYDKEITILFIMKYWSYLGKYQLILTELLNNFQVLQVLKYFLNFLVIKC